PAVSSSRPRACVGRSRPAMSRMCGRSLLEWGVVTTDDDGSPEPQEALEPSWEELFLGQRPCMTRREIAAASGFPDAVTDRFWHALGFPIVEDDEVLFTEA